MSLNYKPNYDLEAVMPMRKDLTDVGFIELLSPEDVENAINSSKDETALFVINSVCGCAAGNARPGVAQALQHSTIPAKLFTVFAGMEKPAVTKFREYLAPNPPTSPAMALFSKGKLVGYIPRLEIEYASAAQVAEKLIAMFEEHCTTKGPSIPSEEFAELEFIQRCGSKLPQFQG